MMHLSGAGPHRDVRELDARAMLTGAIGRAFTRDGNGFGTAEVAMDRAGARTVSGITVMKATASGWADDIKDSYTTIPETHDRTAATSMEAT